VLKGTHSGVDGVYTSDPRLDAGATKLDEISYMDVLNRGLKVMDPTSITFCMDNALPIVVFDMRAAGSIRKVVMGEPVGTTVGA
jgi:uridylate kinase